MVALSMADGYARLTGKPQCVIVHVDVGTQGLGAAVHNASCGRAPVLIFAGLSPFTIEGEMRGSRTEYIHWIQDVPDQKQIVSPDDPLPPRTCLLDPQDVHRARPTFLQVQI